MRMETIQLIFSKKNGGELKNGEFHPMVSNLDGIKSSWEPKGTPPMPRFPQEIAGLIKGP